MRRAVAIPVSPELFFSSSGQVAIKESEIILDAAGPLAMRIEEKGDYIPVSR